VLVQGSILPSFVDEAPMAQSTLEVATEVFVVTSEMRKLMVQLAHVLLGETNAPPPPSESTITTVMETRSGSALSMPTPVTDIMEELTL